MQLRSFQKWIKLQFLNLITCSMKMIDGSRLSSVVDLQNKREEFPVPLNTAATAIDEISSRIRHWAHSHISEHATIGRCDSITMSLLRSLFASASFRQITSSRSLSKISRSFSHYSPRTSTLSTANSSLWTLRSRPGHELTRPETSAATSFTLSLVRGMKTRSSVKRLCDGCKVRII